MTLLSSAGWTTSTQPQPLDNNPVLNHLNAAIGWYRQVASLDVAAGQSSDALYLENARSAASQALQLAFEAALAEAAMAPTAANSGAGSSRQGPSDQQQGIAKAAADTADQIGKTQSQLEALNQQIERAGGKKRQELLSQRDGLQGQLDLDKMIQDALQKVAGVTNNENGGSGLTKQIRAC